MTESVGNVWLWVGFVVFVLAMLALDLGVFHRKSHVVGFREALVWSVVWIGLAMVFNAGVLYWFGETKGVEFFTGYLIEKSLSVDNVFVFVIVFSALAIPPQYQHRVLFWGILGALVMRAVMIFAGAALLAKFHWLIYVFGAFLILTGIKLFWQRDKEQHPEDGLVMRFARRIIPSTQRLDGARFFTVENGKRLATPLFMALVLVEFTDLVFALDSIPAIFAITSDPFIVFTSNIFAILGLRSLFFLLAGLVDKFRYLKIGLAAVLVFVGVKMVIVDLYKFDPFVSLAIIATVLVASVIASLWRSRRTDAESTPPPARDGHASESA
jgi:tellurite resistance protein TerC